MFLYKATTLAIIMVAFGAMTARAQDDEITSIDDFLEESAPESSETHGEATSAPVANASDVTQLDELSVESDVEAEQAKQAKKAESVATIDAAEMQNTSKTVSKAVNSASGVKVRKSGGMGSAYFPEKIYFEILGRIYRWVCFAVQRSQELRTHSRGAYRLREQQHNDIVARSLGWQLTLFVDIAALQGQHFACVNPCRYILVGIGICR